MKGYLFRMGFFLVILLCSASEKALSQEEFCNIQNHAFQSGERLIYRVYYNMAMLWISAGEAQFSVKTESLCHKKTFHFIGEGHTLKAYEWFYKVSDVYESYVDSESLQPMHFIRQVNEGGYRIDNNVYFHHDKHIAITTGGNYNIPTCIQDVLSAIYYARNIDYNKYAAGTKIPFNMFLDNKVYPLFIRYLGKEIITTRYGTFKTIKFKPLLINGTIFSGGEKMTVWVSDDENHVPLRVDTPITIGSIKVDLIGYQHLRHPFRSLITLQ